MAGATVALSGTLLTIGKGAFGQPLTARLTKNLPGAYHLYAIGQQNTSTFGLTANLPVLTFTGRNGGGATLTLPLLTLTASGKVTGLGQLTQNLPLLTLVASGTVTGLGELTKNLPALTLNAHGGLGGRMTLPRLTFTGHGLTGKLAELVRDLPALTLTASGTNGLVASLRALLPALTMSPSGRLVVYLPRLTLRATATPTVAVAYEAYSMVLFPSDKGLQVATTRYTTYPFEQILRFGTKYYGVATDGLLELTGDLFDAAPIVSVVESGETDFNAREMKRPISLYMAGRAGADFRVSVNEAETKTYSYNYHPLTKTGARNYRVLFGRGMRARYLKYTFTNTKGEDFELDELTPEVVVLRRTA